MDMAAKKRPHSSGLPPKLISRRVGWPESSPRSRWLAARKIRSEVQGAAVIGKVKMLSETAVENGCSEGDWEVETGS